MLELVLMATGFLGLFLVWVWLILSEGEYLRERRIRAAWKYALV